MTSIKSSELYELTVYITQMNEIIDMYYLNYSIIPKEK